MNKIQFSSLEEVFECYGRGNLIPIANLEQIIEYTAHGCQPKYICENEVKPGKLTCWFSKDETAYVYRKWLKKKAKEGKLNG
jgi:hypothetical protein